MTFAQDCNSIVSISYDTDHNEISEFSATLASNNYTVNTVSGVTTITPKTGANPIFVNDGAVLTLESDVIFDGCFIFMDVDAHMLVDGAGTDVSFINCTIMSCGDDMWEEILVGSDNNQSLTITGGLIRDGINAVHATNDAELDVNGVEFLVNRISILLENCNVNGSIEINASLFSSNISSICTNLLHPFQNDIAYTGIYADNCAGIHIDDNEFNCLENGIISLNARGDYLDNDFIRMESVAAHSLSGYGTFIRVTNQQPSFTFDHIFRDNDFEACEKAGIRVIGNPDITIIENTFDECVRGIEYRNITPSSISFLPNISITDNDFDDYETAIFFLQTGRYNDIVINDNDLNFNNNLEGENGIFIRNLFGKNASFELNGNEIKDTKKSIRIENMNYLSANVSPFEMDGNSIDMILSDNNTGVQWNGLDFRQCGEIDVENNTIIGFQNATTSGTISNLNNDDYEGIRCSNGNDIVFFNNTIDGTGRGMWFTQNCLGTFLQCNTMSNVNQGVYLGVPSYFLLQPSMSNQGAAGTKEAQNYWDVNQNPRVEGDDIFNLVFWDHSGNALLSNTKHPRKIIGSINNLTIKDNITWQNSICGGGGGSNRENGLDITFEYYILDSIDFEIDYGEEIEYYYKAQLFNQIFNDTSLMYGTSHDSLYQVFYNENLNSNIHQLLIIKQNIDTMAYEIADSLVNQFSADNYIEENMQVVLSHWLRLAMDDNEKLDNNDSLELYDIACLSPTEGGEAVMIARIMLNMDMDEDACSSERLFFNINEKHNQSIKVYPNPAQGYIVLEFEEMFSGSIKIYDMSGRKNLILDITEQKNVELDLSQLAKGMYMVHTINRNGHESRTKVVVYE